MRTVLNEVFSKNPIAIPDDSDLEGLLRKREELAREVEQIESLNKAKRSPEFQQIVLDSYVSMQTIERTAMMLDSKKPDFALTFAGLQGRWRERKTLTEEMVWSGREIVRKKTLIMNISEKLKLLQQRIKALTS